MNESHFAPALALFDWAKKEAQAAAEAETKAKEALDRQARAEKTLQESVEWDELEEAKEKVRKRREELLTDDEDLEEARAEVKKARAAVKGIDAHRVAAQAKTDAKAQVGAASDARRRLQTALVDGKVPDSFEDRAREAGLDLKKPKSGRDGRD